MLFRSCHSQTDTYTGRNCSKNDKSRRTCSECKISNITYRNSNGICKSCRPILLKKIFQEKSHDNLYCKQCSKSITKRSNTNLCIVCIRIKSRKVERPDYKTLINDINELGVSPTGRKYGVSGSSIVKWVKNYEKNGL
mgnify:CR=1 FL=1